MRRDEANVSGGESDVGRPGKPKQDTREPRLMDREVPLPAASGNAVLHDWLDGEVEQARARDEGGKQVDLWNKINAETRMLRSRSTPVHVQKAIMSALPDEAPATSRMTSPKTAMSRKTMFIIGAVAAFAAALAAGLLR